MYKYKCTRKKSKQYETAQQWFLDQIRSYRSTQGASVSFKETNEKITCEEAAENYKTPPTY